MTALKTNMMQVRIQIESAVTPWSKICNTKGWRCMGNINTYVDELQ